MYDAKHILNLNTRCVAASGRLIPKNGNRSVGPKVGWTMWRRGEKKSVGLLEMGPIPRSTCPQTNHYIDWAIPALYVPSAKLNVFREDGLPRVRIQSTVQVNNPVSKQTALKLTVYQPQVSEV